MGSLIDPAAAVARHLRHRLEHLHLVLPSGAETGVQATARMWTSADPDQMRWLVAQLWGQALPVVALPTRFSQADLEHTPDL
jgi:hypothetical protein